MWKIIPDTNDCYSANINGEIKSNDRLGTDGRKLKGKIIKPWLINSNYQVVCLMIDGKKQKHLVHRLIYKTFSENYDEKLDIDHIDGNKINNNFKNLEQVTRSENILRAYKKGLATPFTEGKILANKKLQLLNRKERGKSIQKIDPETGEVVEVFETMGDAQRKYNYSISTIRKCIRGIVNLAYGYKWMDVEKV